MPLVKVRLLTPCHRDGDEAKKMLSIFEWLVPRQKNLARDS